MAWRSVLPGGGDFDAREDAKGAEPFGPYRVSARAVYLPGREYLPLEAVKQARLYRSQMNTHGCCGLALPVWYVLLYEDGADRPHRLTFEKREQAQALLDRLASLHAALELLPARE